MRARVVACVLLLTGAVTGGRRVWRGRPRRKHLLHTSALSRGHAAPVESTDATGLPIVSVVVTTTATAAASRARGIPRCCTSDRDASQPQAPRTLVTASDWSIDLQSARVSLVRELQTPAPRLLRDAVPLAPASTSRHVLFSVFIV